MNNINWPTATVLIVVIGAWITLSLLHIQIPAWLIALSGSLTAILHAAMPQLYKRNKQ